MNDFASARVVLVLGFLFGQVAAAQSADESEQLVNAKPATEGGIPGSADQQIAEISTYLAVLPRMLRAISGSENINTGFAWSDQSPYPVTAMLQRVLEKDPQLEPVLESTVLDHSNLTSLEHWARTGDDFTRGMFAQRLKRHNPAAFDRIFALTKKEIETSPDKLRPTYRFLLSLTDEEKFFYDGYHDYYFELVARYLATP